MNQINYSKNVFASHEDKQSSTYVYHMSKRKCQTQSTNEQKNMIFIKGET